MNILKLYIDFNENVKDYVSAKVYDFSGVKIMDLPDVRKPDDLSSYTIEWKNGLYYFYEGLIREKIDYFCTIIQL